MTDKRLKILFVTTDSYPYFGTTSNLIKKLVFNGGLINVYDIGVLSFCNNFSMKTYEVCDGVEIYRIFSFCELHGNQFWSELNKRPIYFRILPLLEKVIWWLVEKTGSSARLFRLNNVIRIKKLLEHDVATDYDFVVPICGNYDSVIATLISKIPAKKIFWQVDPCSTNYIRLFREKYLSKKIERKIVREFDCILTEEIYYKELEKLYGDSIHRNVRVFHFPLIDQSLSLTMEKNMFDENKINCVFAGLIYLGIRDPMYTLRLFKALNQDLKIQLHMYGPEKTSIKCDDDSIVIHEKVTMDKMPSILLNADFLVNIGNVMNNQIPSKIFEYISTGLPIINICKNRDCPTIELLKNYNYSISIIEDNNLFEAQLLELKKFINLYRGKRNSPDLLENEYGM